jgi:type I restriction enzyme S subunit
VNTGLPENWVEAGFGELNQFESRTLNPSQFGDEVFELYSVPAFSTRKPESVIGREIGSTKQLVEPGDVLVCKINPRINRVWQVLSRETSRQIASSEWIVMRSPELHAAYLRYYFLSPAFRGLICEGVTGVGGSFTRAQPKRVASFSVPLAPLNEQKRIADKLDTLLVRA